MEADPCGGTTASIACQHLESSAQQSCAQNNQPDGDVEHAATGSRTRDPFIRPELQRPSSVVVSEAATLLLFPIAGDLPKVQHAVGGAQFHAHWSAADECVRTASQPDYNEHNRRHAKHPHQDGPSPGVRHGTLGLTPPTSVRCRLSRGCRGGASAQWSSSSHALPFPTPVRSTCLIRSARRRTLPLTVRHHRRWSITYAKTPGRVAQLARAFALHAKGPGFESPPAH